jgi:prophage regulatory protein
MEQQMNDPYVYTLIRIPAIKKYRGESAATIYRSINRGLFTRPVKIGGDRSAWPLSEVEAINRARIAGMSEDEIRKLVKKLETERKNFQA